MLSVAVPPLFIWTERMFFVLLRQNKLRFYNPNILFTAVTGSPGEI